jgi:hypothetical protein
MKFSKWFYVRVVCVCGAKLDAVLDDDDKNDITVIVDNTHICPAAQHSVQRTAVLCEVEGCGKEADLIVCAGHVP